MNLIRVTDYHAEELNIYARLNESQLLHYHEPDYGIFIAESAKVIMRAMDAGYEPISFLADDHVLETEAKPVLERLPDGIPIYTGPFEVLSQMTGFHVTRGALCAMRRRELPKAAELCKNARRVVVLEDVENPTNIGSIFRSAAALNMDAVLLTKKCGDPLYRRAARVSMGTVFQIPWTYISGNEGNSMPVGMNYCIHNSGLVKTTYLDTLRNMGFKTVAMALREDCVDIDNPSLRKEAKLAILMGNEGEGLADETIGRSDYVVKIPMTHGVDSLNVAAASAVAFWELGKQ